MRLDLLRGLREGSNNSWDRRLHNANSLFKIGLCGDSRKRYEQGASFPPDRLKSCIEHYKTCHHSDGVL